MESDDLRLLPALDDDMLMHYMKEELPAYLVAAAAVKDVQICLLWWKGQTQLPAWQKAAKITYAPLPSSAPPECVFSILRAATNHLEHNLLVDHLDASLILQYSRGHGRNTRLHVPPSPPHNASS